MELQKPIGIDWQLVKRSLIYTFIWGMAAHAYAFANLTISHDSLYEFISTYWQHLWKGQLGRIFAPLYRELFRGIVAIPWLAGVLSLLWIGITVYFVLRMCSVQNKVFQFFITGVLTVNLSVITNAATFIGDLDVNMMALLLAAAAAYMWWRFPKYGFLFGMPLLMVSIGLYQSYIAVAIVLIELICILWLLDGVQFSRVLGSGCKGVAMLLGGGGLYILALKVFTLITEKSFREGTSHGVANLWTESIADKLKQVFPSYSLWARQFTRPVSVFPATIILIANCILLAITVYAIVTAIRKHKIGMPGTLLMLGLLGLIPISACIICLLNKGICNELTRYAVWLIYLLPLALLEQDAREQYSAIPKRLNRALCIVSCAMLSIFLWGNMLTANTAYLKKDLERQATLSSMTRAMSDLNHQPNYIKAETPIAFYGFNTEFGFIEGFEDLEPINGLEINSQITYDYHWAYIHYILNEDVVLCPTEKYKQIENSEELAAMPCFQQDGYIQMIDGVMVVKMGP